MGKSAGRLAATVVAAAVVASVLAGCVAGATLTEPTATPTPTPEVTDGMDISIAPTAQETCDELIDIGTLLFNEQIAFNDGRVAEQEYDAANRLVSRLILRVDASGGSDLADSVERLQEIVGPYRMGAMTTFDPTTPEWAEAFSAAQTECGDAGIEFYTEGWTGG